MQARNRQPDTLNIFLEANGFMIIMPNLACEGCVVQCGFGSKFCSTARGKMRFGWAPVACTLFLRSASVVGQSLAAFESASSTSTYSTDGFAADLAVTAGSGYWCSAGGHAAGQVVSWTGVAGSRVQHVNFISNQRECLDLLLLLRLLLLLLVDVVKNILASMPFVTRENKTSNSCVCFIQVPAVGVQISWAYAPGQAKHTWITVNSLSLQVFGRRG